TVAAPRDGPGSTLRPWRASESDACPLRRPSTGWLAMVRTRPPRRRPPGDGWPHRTAHRKTHGTAAGPDHCRWWTPRSAPGATARQSASDDPALDRLDHAVLGPRYDLQSGCHIADGLVVIGVDEQLVAAHDLVQPRPLDDARAMRAVPPVLALLVQHRPGAFGREVLVE